MALTAHSAEFDVRPGEQSLPHDPAARAPDAGLVFIGRVASPWTRREDCPKNTMEALGRGKTARLKIDEPYRAGLDGLDGYSHLILLTWLDRAPRDLIKQTPRHAETARGTFALRSPVRPNPIGLHVVPIVSVNVAEGIIEIAGIDVLDETPILDIKSYFASTDAIADATRPVKA